MPPTVSAQQNLDIRLPQYQKPVKHVAIDIGGSLAKVVYLSEDDGGTLHFLKFETERIDQCFDTLQALTANNVTRIAATGGGAYKYYDQMKELLGVEVHREDEMECLMKGLHFLITGVPKEVFVSSGDGSIQYQDTRSEIYPYLLVNIGSGVSVVKISGEKEYERVGGTSLGGGTLFGLLTLLTGADTYDDMLALSEKGDNANIDMLVKDIYGQGYEKIGLPGNIVASSFGKVWKRKRQGESHAENFGDVAKPQGQEREFEPQDISRSLFVTLSNNIAQIAYLYSEKHELQNIYFGGSFIQGHHQIVDSLSNAISFWSGGTKQAYFLRHEGYLGSLGAFIKQ